MATYKKQELPSKELKEKDFYWAAGFLEGEGSFSIMSGTDLRARITAGQKIIEPLQKLLEIFGGRIYTLKNRTYNTWMLRGE